MPDLLIALRAVVALAAVLGLLLFLSKRLQKSQAKGGDPLAALLPKRLTALLSRRAARPVAVPRARKKEKITVIARAGLGGRAQLVVAEFDGIRYVLGVGDHGISVVDTQEAPIPDEETVDSGSTGETPDLPSEGGERALKPVA
ncbi:flagellar biosynthetic protein FliO [Streptomyces sp. AC495_CC817]|uniref:flagellar biosynthetic protein FliO n=1 Tax=Streptomyces sp. AC495_CC817 TaxID=2823900 RepID=UPI001C278012|nr:flagellar biosynthetic protein FliO [Streptomyces sp. AC495_CC817]